MARSRYPTANFLLIFMLQIVLQLPSGTGNSTKCICKSTGRASDARRIHAEHLQTHAQLQRGGAHPIDDGGALKVTTQEIGGARFQPGKSLNMISLRNDSIIWIRSDYFFFSFLYYMKETWLIKLYLRVRCMARARPTRSARERSDGRSCQWHCLLSGLRYPTKLDA